MSFVVPAGLSRQMTANDGPWLNTREESSPRHLSAPRSTPEPGTSVLVLTGPITRADFPALCKRAREVLQGKDCDPVVCDVGALADPDAVTVDALTRLQLTARRVGRRVQLRHACVELQDLLAFMGLDDVLPCGAASGVEPRGQAEEREQACGVEEKGDPGDPIA
jgi:ABC-type transporter Mla MlaB component